MSMRTAHSGSGVVTVLMHGSGLSSLSIAEAVQFGHPPLCRICQAAMSMRSPQGSRFHSDGGGPQLIQATGNPGSASG